MIMAHLYGSSSCISILTFLLLQQRGFIRLDTAEAQTVGPILETPIRSDRVVFPDELEELLIKADDSGEEGEIHGSSFSDTISGEDEDGDVSEYISSELMASTEIELLCKSDLIWDPVFKRKIMLMEKVVDRPFC
ncbi:unnamed protein product [Ceratitis capitata]|uniref:(Mediterranean fruit fly) hypothetical protein n=1 Tax=Ceratitis capitata TaxID=7213 RepID=A0A811UIN5_CERCA|nr:unnamed protein product [Ceratitis capitata]